MALVLNIETATTNCSVSLSKDGETLVLKEDNSLGYSHAETLHLFIDEVFKTAKIKPSEIDAVAVSKGPGSYTGLRIGVSSAKGLCFALNKPLIAISTLESLACQVKTDDGFIVPMLDARRMEVYAAIYNSNLELEREIKAEILTEESYMSILETNKVYFIGSGVTKAKALIQHPNAVFIDGKLPSANEMSSLAEIKYKKSDTEDVAYFEPYYLKDFVALKKKA
ncbi:tRNA (adenosine(37)-N6)-threonylcarbamoyltransferase complex dimerization subunit type 1 TsaB [Winogradskyella psychrotolerans]|uniref:tRNA (adenosine(37)-N6)-threonylcarbamoyltransferase complex dimerization subunit type 1 TsaB n=1 Tax=Winogradskyella psychrotolerans TaxID=1344585 RepID=UPI001C073EF8|nr:tRNA (adenosine(37)-N6)-threonylcarbamoyltransferase complex dimerization subunit type 1 TsaB [Winogradskyella psychrotolerans]MBU2922434.1 tRNA (adenosine(37)-N6)-threonylcarbamoyltransferase complex dimerization subunit type 1 TsaB [Winogradskyella psychrotolerans]